MGQKTEGSKGHKARGPELSASVAAGPSDTSTLARPAP
ncbi:Hypothetical protein PFCIRM119_04575 [Propionibacterium freudenreichii]|uniref:Uncharacterized protein n=2 Tax=Propionibacterium freudenreichii TaxID=1744 RepID=D7GIF3_PROFC|nr:Hypothetical protein PFREUD_03440 [Propionibacterium freudenreichii subsp. shermanii CIRM-BIA1]CDP49701.1 Hypothetical protein PFCIRM129_01615 [Propionibacterium freudenreichii subsp. freudenreichii]CEG86679.1 Hypothetical protein PFCIRM118_07660 [Propionibacterium freudenreichii]CUW21360.1 conserved protein [Propionibacterium freudenreichii subsp. shermanii]CEG90924.1 Hypothetical protein PFCIRM119_04575 [Propionibacterium freudenreichii]